MAVWIEFIKTCDFGFPGEKKYCANKGAENLIDNGYAKYLDKPDDKVNKNEEIKKLDETKSQKTKKEVGKTPSTRVYLALKEAFKEKINYQVKTEEEQQKITKEIVAIGINDETLKRYIKSKYPEEEKQILKRAQSILKKKEEKDKKAEEKRAKDFQKQIIKNTDPSLQIATKKDSKKIYLPCEGHVSATEFIKDVIRHTTGNEHMFYRSFDDTIVEFKKGKLREITPSRTVSLIEEYADVFTIKWNAGAREYQDKKKSANQTECKVLLENPEFKDSLHPIKNTFLLPYPFLKNGKIILPKKGYNPELQAFLDPESPTITQDITVKQAKITLLNLYKEFCFKNQDDILTSIMSLLTPFCRGVYNEWNTRCPIYISFANRERAGKDYLAGIRGIIIDGKAKEYGPISTGEKNNHGNEELLKQITTAMINGEKIMHFANNKGNINSSTLEYAQTARVIVNRILGSNRNIEKENDLDFSLSGNMGCTLSPDMANRSTIIELELLIEKANERGFDKPNLHSEILKNRGYIIGCLFALVKNWYDKGMPKSKVKYASYPEWAEVVGGIMESAGWENPNEIIKNVHTSLDSEGEDMKLVYENAYVHFPEKWISKSDLKSSIMEQELFSYIDLSEKSGQIKMGLIIDKFKNRILSDITMKGDGNKRTNREKVKFTKEKIVSVKLEDCYDFETGMRKKPLDISGLRVEHVENKSGHGGKDGNGPLSVLQDESSRIQQTENNIAKMTNMTTSEQVIDEDVKPVVGSGSPIVVFLSDNNQNGGINFEKVFEKSGLDEKNFNVEIERLLKNGDIFMPKPGFLKVLE